MLTFVQFPVVAGLVMTGLVLVPPNRATLGAPYWASLPNVLMVGRQHVPEVPHAGSGGENSSWVLLSDQNG